MFSFIPSQRTRRPVVPARAAAPALALALALAGASTAQAQLGPDGRADQPLSVTAPATPQRVGKPSHTGLPPGSPATQVSATPAGVRETPGPAYGVRLVAAPSLAVAPSAERGALPPGRDVAAVFARTDRDGDGRIDAREAQRLPDVARRFARIDRDGDGGLTLAELAAATVRPAAPTTATATRARRLDLANPG